MGGLRKAKCWALGLMLAGMVLAVPVSARADDLAKDAGIGVGTALLNLLYIPAKITYATLGGLTGGLAYALTGGSLETARQVWEPSMGGTYVLSPDMLRGEEPVRFSGSSAPSNPTETTLKQG